jgi:hypothetical protein
MKIWKEVVILVVWNSPPKIPIPLFKNKKFRLSYETIVAISKIVIVALEYKIDLSRLKLIELDNSNIINDMININQKKELNFH